MKRWQLAVGGLATIAMVSVASLRAADDAKGKYTTKQVMAACMKSGLCKKVADGKASDAEKAKLVEMFAEMGKNKPPKGDAEGFKAKADAIHAAAKAVVDGEDGAGAKLAKAANCAACHKEHKPS
jgi:hypothetical protein